jgi:hypothetical protein
MHNPALTRIQDPGPVALPARWRLLFIGLGLAGVAAFALGLRTDPVRAWHNYLVGYYLFLCFGLVGLFFTALNHAVNATWVIAVRRTSEGLAAYLPVALVLFIGIIVGLRYIYPWVDHPELFHDPAKARWLSPLFWSLRHIACLVVWIFFARVIVGFSLKQDQTGDIWLSRKAMRWSVGFMPVFAITFALMCFDLIMSLEPNWYSTMFGVYGFAGLFQSGIALITLVFLWLKRKGPLANAATPSQIKDLGTYLFAFTIFMAYIGFSQYMLIWYANMPEETVYFMNRQQNGWQYLFMALPVFKFVIPFFGLISQDLKRRERWLMAVCWVIIIGQFIDVYWMVMPAWSRALVPIGWMELGIMAGFAGIFGLVVARFYAAHSVLAARDPRILESVNWRFWE